MALDASYLEFRNRELQEEVDELRLITKVLASIKDPENQTLIPFDKVKADMEIEDLKIQVKVLAMEANRLRDENV